MFIFFIRIVLIFLLAWIFQAFGLPFWVVAVAGFVIGLAFSEKARNKRTAYSSRNKKEKEWSFWTGFIAVFLLWGIMAWWLNDTSSDKSISHQVFSIVSGGSTAGYGSVILGFLTALIGGLLGGMGSLTGQLLGKLVKK